MKQTNILLLLCATMFAACSTEEPIPEKSSFESTSLPDESTGPVGPHENWNESEKRCTNHISKRCIRQRKDAPQIPPRPNALDVAIGSGGQKLMDYFLNGAYKTFWPGLENDFDISGLKTGLDRIIKYHNATLNTSFYLIGSASKTDAEIQSAPDFTLVFEEK